MLEGKSVLITGGTGTFGRKATEIILKKYQPRRLIIFSRDEFKQAEMARMYPDSKYDCMRYFIGDVRDKERLQRAFQWRKMAQALGYIVCHPKFRDECRHAVHGLVVGQYKER